ncbi:MAG TPA: class I SAM-dependent methyltransferase [Stellaceae bacterium]|nr:class I SAM-dependent methyltransferase [Stellaceae bacterium]
MSALDNLIRRLMSQRASLERAAAMVTQLPGPALQIGWGDGAAYDHLREILRRREIIVFDRQIAAAADAPPPAAQRVIGDPRETLPQAWDRCPREAALAHLNVLSPRMAAELAPLAAPMLRPGAVVVSEVPLDLPGWEPIAPTEAVRDGRDYLYRVV